MDVDGPQLRRLRENAGLSLTECAAQSSVSRSHLSEIERGIKNPSPSVCARLASTLGCAVVDLRA